MAIISILMTGPDTWGGVQTQMPKCPLLRNTDTKSLITICVDMKVCPRCYRNIKTTKKQVAELLFVLQV